MTRKCVKRTVPLTHLGTYNVCNRENITDAIVCNREKYATLHLRIREIGGIVVLVKYLWGYIYGS